MLFIIFFILLIKIKIIEKIEFKINVKKIKSIIKIKIKIKNILNFYIDEIKITKFFFLFLNFLKNLYKNILNLNVKI